MQTHRLLVFAVAFASSIAYSQVGALSSAFHGVPNRSLFGECDTPERILPGSTPKNFHITKEVDPSRTSFPFLLERSKGADRFAEMLSAKPQSAFTQSEGRSVFNIFAYCYSIAEMLERCSAGKLNRTSLTAMLNQMREDKKEIPKPILLLAALEAEIADIDDKDLRKDISDQIRESGAKGIKADPTQAMKDRLLRIQKQLGSEKDPAAAWASLNPTQQSLMRLLNEQHKVDGQTLNTADLLFGYDMSQYFRFLAQDGNPQPANARYSLDPSDKSFLFHDVPEMQTAEDKQILDQLKKSFELKMKNPSSMDGLPEIMNASRALEKLSVEGGEKWRTWLRDRLSDFPSGNVQPSRHGSKSGDWLRQSYTRSALQNMALDLDRKFHPDLPNILVDLQMDENGYTHFLDIERAVFETLPKQTVAEVDELATYIGKHFGVKLNSLARLSLAGQSMRDGSTPEDLSPLQRELLVHLSRNPKTDTKGLATAITQPTTTTVMEFALRTPETRRELYSLLANRLKSRGLPPGKLSLNIAETEAASFDERIKLHDWATKELLSQKHDKSTEEALALLIASIEETGHPPEAIALLHRGQSRFHPPYISAQAHLTEEVAKKATDEDKRAVKQFERFLYDGNRRGLPIASRNALLAMPPISKAKLMDILKHARGRSSDARIPLEALIVTADEAAIDARSSLARPEVHSYLNVFGTEFLGDKVILSLMKSGDLDKPAKRALESLALNDAGKAPQSSKASFVSLLNEAYERIYGELITEAATRLLAGGNKASSEYQRALHLFGGDEKALSALQAEADLRRHIGTHLESFLDSQSISSMSNERENELPELVPLQPEKYAPEIEQLNAQLKRLDEDSLARARTIQRTLVAEDARVKNNTATLEATKKRTFENEDEKNREIQRVEEIVRTQKTGVDKLVAALAALKQTSGEEIDGLKKQLNAAHRKGSLAETAAAEKRYAELAAKYIAAHPDLAEFTAQELAPAIVEKFKLYKRRQVQLKTLAETQDSTSHDDFVAAWKRQAQTPGHIAHLSERDQASALRQAEKKAQSDLKKRYEKRDKLIGELEKVGAEFDGVQLTHRNANIPLLPPGHFEAAMKGLGQWDDFKASALKHFDEIGHKGVFKLNDQTAIEVVSTWKNGEVTEQLHFKPITAETKRLEKVADETGKWIDELPTLRRTQEGYLSQSLPKLLHGYPGSAIESLGIPLDPRAEQFLSLRKMWLPAYFGEPQFEIKDGQIISHVDKQIEAQEKKIEKNIKDLEANGPGLLLGYRGVERSGAEWVNLFREKMALHSQASIEGAKNTINDIEWTRNFAIEGLVTVPLVMASGGTYAALRGAVAVGRFGNYTRNIRRAMAFARVVSGGTKGMGAMLRFSALSTSASMALGTYTSYYGFTAVGYGTPWGGEYQSMQELMTRDQGQWKNDEWLDHPNGKPDWMDHRDANKQLLVSTDEKYKNLVLKPEFDKNGNQIPDAAEGTFDFFSHLPSFGSYANQLQRGAITFGAAKPLGLGTKLLTGGVLPFSRWTQNMFGMLEATALNDGFISPFIEHRITSNAGPASSWTDIGKQSLKNIVYMSPADDWTAMGTYWAFNKLAGTTKGLSILNGTNRAVTFLLRKPYNPFKPGDILPGKVAQRLARFGAWEANQEVSGGMAAWEHKYGASPTTGDEDTRGGYFSSGSNVRSRGIWDAYFKGRAEGFFGDLNASKLSAGDGLSHFVRGKLLTGTKISEFTKAGYDQKDLNEGLESIEMRDLDPRNPNHRHLFDDADAKVAGGNITDAFGEEKQRSGYFRQQDSWTKTVQPRLQKQIAKNLYLDDTLSLQQAMTKVVHPEMNNLANGAKGADHRITEMLNHPEFEVRERALRFIREIPVRKMITVDSRGKNPVVRDEEHKTVLAAIARENHIPPENFEAYVLTHAGKIPPSFTMDNLAEEYLRPKPIPDEELAPYRHDENAPLRFPGGIPNP